MLTGVPKEIKNHEYCMGMIPASVQELTNRGHSVIVETLDGGGVGFTDDDYSESGAVARTSTLALNKVTLPQIAALADLGWEAAPRRDPHLVNGLNVHAGEITCPEAAEALERNFVEYKLSA